MLWEPAWQALWRVESIGDGSKKVAVLQPGLEWIPEDEIFWHQKKIVNKSLETEAGQERPKEWKIQGSGRRSGHQEVEEMLQDFHQFSSAAQSCPTLCDPMDCCTPGFLVLHSPLELTQIYVHWVGDAIQPSHLLFPPSPPALNLSQHQGLFQCVSSLHQEFQLQHQSFQWIFTTDFL